MKGSFMVQKEKKRKHGLSRCRLTGSCISDYDERHVKNVLLGGEGGKKKRRRPRKKWLEAKTSGYWEEITHERERWRLVLKEIEAMDL